ncbi:MAG TPA: hypothetical protein VIZ22_09465 [Candidatus Limnocylindrales bacterium]
MSRSFLILTTLPRTIDDPSERTAVLAARREAAIAREVAEAVAAGRSAHGPAGAPADRRLFFGWVDRIGRAHFWPGLLR